MRKKRFDIIAVDFDGTLTSAPVDWPTPGPQKWIHKIVLWWIKRHQARGSKIIINTLREDSKDALFYVYDWCAENNFTPDYINENDPEGVQRWGESRKIAADVYIDDRNIGFLGWALRKVSQGRV